MCSSDLARANERTTQELNPGLGLGPEGPVAWSARAGTCYHPPHGQGSFPSARLRLRSESVRTYLPLSPPGPLQGSLEGLTLLLLPLCVVGCRAPEVHAADADREVYEMVLERREELFGESGTFSIDPPADSLRQRILSGEWEASQPQPLSLVDCLVIAAENSREVQSQRESLYRSALDLSLERWQYSTQFFGDVSGGVSGTGDGGDVDANVDSSLGFSRLLGTGASIVTTLGNGMFRIGSTGAPWDELANLTLSITQPLLRGAGRAIALEPLTQAERDLIYAVRSYERFRRTYAVDVAGRVYGLLQAIDELKNEERNYDALVELRERTEIGRASCRARV